VSAREFGEGIVHWAKTLHDSEETACGERVGEVLSMTGDDVTTRDVSEFLADPEGCEACKDELR